MSLEEPTSCHTTNTTGVDCYLTPIQEAVLGPLPKASSGNKYIHVVVVIDLFTKWVEAFPVNVTDTKTLASLLINEIVCRYGIPSYVYTQ